jgi:nicotinate-nucleotide adenylyltransferase
MLKRRLCRRYSIFWMRKVGLFFGSFNPVHVGHMVIATWAVEMSDLQEVWFVVSPHNPLKKKETLLNGRQRLEMVQRAIGDDGRFRASDIEFGLSQPSYTAHTLVHLQEKHPKVEFTLLMGGDNLASFHRWKNYQAIMDAHPIIVYSRPGEGELPFLEHPNVRLLVAPALHISSSLIRKLVKDGYDVRHLMPMEAWKFMEEMNFYKG